MNNFNEILTDKIQTINKIKQLIDKYHNDVNFRGISVRGFFDWVKNLPYRKDPKPIEVVGRPLRIIPIAKQIGIDCKKKAVLMGSYAKQNNIEYRIVVSSNRPDGQIHHIFLQYKINGRWLNADSTYSHLKFAEPKKLTNYEIH